HTLAPLLAGEGGGCAGTGAIGHPSRPRTLCPRQPGGAPPPQGEATRPKKASHFVGIVPIREVQNNLRTEAQVPGRLMGTDEGEKRLAFILLKAHRSGFRTRHSRLP